MVSWPRPKGSCVKHVEVVEDWQMILATAFHVALMKMPRLSKVHGSADWTIMLLRYWQKQGDERLEDEDVLFVS